MVTSPSKRAKRKILEDSRTEPANRHSNDQSGDALQYKNPIARNEPTVRIPGQYKGERELHKEQEHHESYESGAAENQKSPAASKSRVLIDEEVRIGHIETEETITARLIRSVCGQSIAW